MKIVKYSHFITVSNFSSNEEIVAMRQHCYSLIHKERHRKADGSFEDGEKRDYFLFNKDLMQCHFHVNDLPNLLERLRVNGVNLNNIEITDVPMYTPDEVDFEINSFYTPRESQKPIIEYFNDPFPHIKLCELETGGGKTYMAIKSLKDRKSRGMLVIRPQYFDNWTKAIFGEGNKKPLTDLEEKDVLIIQGSDKLKQAIRDALDGNFDYKFIMISNTTLFRMIKLYESAGSTVSAFGCEPFELCRIFGVGTLLKDEGHMDFHANFRLDLLMHVPISITLSATFSSDNPFISRMQLLQHPADKRAPSVALSKFRHVVAIRYFIDEKRPLQWKLRGRTDFNQNQLEKSILENKRARKTYLELVYNTFEEYFLKRITNPEQKCLILCGRVEMIEVIIQYFTDIGVTLNLAKYASGDDFIECCKSDVIVTTIISGKAAIDIPNLITCIMTVNMGAKETNVQALGRLRELPHMPEIKPTFVYLYCQNIPSCYNYHTYKQELFRNRASSQKDIASGMVL